MSEAYIKSIDAFADSGNKAYAAARQRAAELKELATYMREVNRRHSETIEKFSSLMDMINQYGHNEKAKLKRFRAEYEKREKSMKKCLRKNKQDPSEPLSKFYVDERNVALRQQHQRYKQHNGYGYEDGYVEPSEYNEQNESFENAAVDQTNRSHEHTTSTHDDSSEAIQYHDDHESFLNENFTLKPAPTSQPDAQSDFLAPPEEQPLTSPPSPRQKDQLVSADVQMRHRDAEQRTNTVEKATLTTDRSNAFTNKSNALDQQVISYRDVATTTEPYENYTREYDARMHRAKRPSSYMEENLQRGPIAAVRRSFREQTSSQSMTALNESLKDDAHMNDYIDEGKDRRQEPTKDSEVMFRASQLNAVPTAFVQAPFMTSDYGKTLVCIHNFHGQTADQLSLKNGEKVILMKCGSKGWIFAKHVDTQRTGWFPSRFVRADTVESSSTENNSPQITAEEK
ncbi:unnamed protein product [Anisakis simplex]|uniref:SH3 domain-containing protein n=1 Tax=Anisakis simplex TaxID=6269 RepID=A0A0M3JY00_ANISI|nr:unnamed protein product [Anisakis simplex]